MEERVERRRGSVCASVKQNNQRMTQERAIVKQDCAIHTLTSALTFVIAWYWICLKSPYHYGISTLPGLAEQGWSRSLALCRCCAQLLSHPESFQVSRFKLWRGSMAIPGDIQHCSPSPQLNQRILVQSGSTESTAVRFRCFQLASLPNKWMLSKGIQFLSFWGLHRVIVWWLFLGVGEAIFVVDCFF